LENPEPVPQELLDKDGNDLTEEERALLARHIPRSLSAFINWNRAHPFVHLNGEEVAIVADMVNKLIVRQDPKDIAYFTTAIFRLGYRRALADMEKGKPR